MSTDPGSLNPVQGEAEYPGGGIPDPYEYWDRWHSFDKTYLICIIA